MKKRRNKKSIKIFISLFLLFIVLFAYYFFVCLPVVETYTKAEANSITERAINLAISNVINRTISYDSLIDINYSSAGEIVSFSANQYEINTITREIVKETQYNLSLITNSQLKLNLGTFTGIPFFIGRGPLVNLRIVPIGAVKSLFDSEFNSVGINMTKHTLFLYIDVHISVVLPIKSYDVYTKNQVMLAESIIVGKVPEVYLNGGSLGKSLNLVP